MNFKAFFLFFLSLFSCNTSHEPTKPWHLPTHPHSDGGSSVPSDESEEEMPVVDEAPEMEDPAMENPDSEIDTTDAGIIEADAEVPIEMADAGSEMQDPTVARLDLAPSPVSATYVKKAVNANSVGITVTTGAEPKSFSELALVGQAEIANSGCVFGEDCARQAFGTRINVVALYDGDTQVGYGKIPDANSGVAVVTNLNITVPPHTTKTFTVKVGLGSMVSESAPYDRFAIGISEDVEGFEVSAALYDQGGAEPSIVQTIRPHGEVTIQPINMPASRIVVAGNNEWEMFAQYHGTASYEAASMDMAALEMLLSEMSDPSDLSEVAIASNGVFCPAEPMNDTGMVNAECWYSPITIPKDGAVNFQLYAKTNSIIATALSSSETGVPRSGHAPQLGISSDITTREWGDEYSGNLNVRITGMTSGERLFAAKGASPGNPMVLRKSYPLFWQNAVANTTLANIDQDVISYHVTAVGAGGDGAVGILSKQFLVNKVGNFSMTHFRLRRDAVEMDPSSYSIRVLGLDQTTIGPEVMTTRVAVTFYSEEVIGNSGHNYSLHATMNGVTDGCALMVSLFAEEDTSIMTGRMTVSTGGRVNIFDDGRFNSTNFGWSDLSEVPHSDAYVVQTHPGLLSSADWTNGYLLQDLSFTQILSR